MLGECLPTAVLKAKTHSIFVTHNKKIVALPKGPGVISDAQIPRLHGFSVPLPVVRKLGQQLEIARECFERHFPNLLR